MDYRVRLLPWIVIRRLPKMQRVVVGRFRTESDADGFATFLRRQIPDGNFAVIYDQPENSARDAE